MNHRFATALAATALAALAGCATKPPAPAPAPALYTAVEPWTPPTPELAQIVFLSPGDAPAAADPDALFELEGDRRVLVAALGAHTGAFRQVKPGHHVFMAVGRAGHLIETDVEGGHRYYVLLRPDGRGDLVPLPMRMTEGTEISNRNPESGQWVAASNMVEKTPAADIWFAAKKAQIDAAQAAALADWRGKTAPQRDALTLHSVDAALP